MDRKTKIALISTTIIIIIAFLCFMIYWIFFRHSENSDQKYIEKVNQEIIKVFAEAEQEAVKLDPKTQLINQYKLENGEIEKNLDIIAEKIINAINDKNTVLAKENVIKYNELANKLQEWFTKNKIANEGIMEFINTKYAAFPIFITDDGILMGAFSENIIRNNLLKVNCVEIKDGDKTYSCNGNEKKCILPILNATGPRDNSMIIENPQIESECMPNPIMRIDNPTIKVKNNYPIVMINTKTIINKPFDTTGNKFCFKKILQKDYMSDSYKNLFWRDC